MDVRQSLIHSMCSSMETVILQRFIGCFDPVVFSIPYDEFLASSERNHGANGAKLKEELRVTIICVL